MQIGMIGLGRMGGNMVRRLIGGGHACVVFDRQPESVAKSVADGATGSQSLEEFTRSLASPRVIWLMLPAAVVDSTIEALSLTCSRATLSSTAAIRITWRTFGAPRSLLLEAFTTWMSE